MDTLHAPIGSLSDRIKEAVIRRLLDFTGSQKFLSTQLDITNACNLRCVHCYHPHHSNAEALSLQDWRKILDQYAALAAKLRLLPIFTLCGGEPTLSPLFFPILEELNSRWPGVRITVLTNATRLSAPFVRSISRFNLGFQISLDGPDRARHDAIRGPGSFDSALLGLSNLQEAGMNAKFLATLSHRTSAWIGDFFETAARCGVSQMNFTRFIPEGAGRRLQEEAVDRPLAALEIRDAFTEILRRSRASGVATNTNQPLFHLIDPSLGAHGKSGFQGLVIDYQGNLKVTSRASPILGSVLKEGLEKLFLHHPLMEALRDREIEGCGSCPRYEHCEGDRNSSYAATGSFLRKDPGCWLGLVPQEAC